MSDTITFISFKKIKDIGNDEGKNSDVFLAIDEQLGDELVIKQMEKNKFTPKEYFLESNMLYASKHPHIVEIQYASQDEDYIYLAMPYYKNGSINSLMKTKNLTVREIIKYSLDLLSGVIFIHSKKLLHLDIKPTNVLIDNSGKAVLADFGLSKYVDDNGIADQQLTYTHHADPEWFQHAARTVQSDIYQIGLTIYKLCNDSEVLGRQIVEQSIMGLDDLNKAVQNSKFPSRNEFLPHIPKKLRKVVIKALEVDTFKRYQNTIEIMNDLSVIDDNLDWVYTGDENNPYYKIQENHRISIEVNDHKDAIICTKTNNITGRTTKMHKFCSKCGKKDGELGKLISKVIGEIS